jgi:hypothetical protein
MEHVFELLMPAVMFFAVAVQTLVDTLDGAVRKLRRAR